MTSADRQRESSPAASVRSAANATALIVALAWSVCAQAQNWDHRGSDEQTQYGSDERNRDLASSKTPPPVRPPDRSDRPSRPRYGHWAPGQTLPPDAQAVVLTDYERYHLRRPPRGYEWLLCDGDYVLAASATRLIFDVIPASGE